jgi:DNA transposition AAA+ family ATPase
MYDWIIEADIYRLKKAARDTTQDEERRMFERLVREKEHLLAQQRANRLPPSESSLRFQ